MIDSQGQVRITDFGLAKRTEGDIAVTQTGQSLGTPLYMAPEVAKGEEADARSDLYALGAAEGRTPSELIVKHATETPRPLGEVAPHVDRRLTAIIDRLLRKNPASRYPSARALLEALDALGEVRGGPAGGRVADPAAGTMTLPSARRMERQFAAARHAERRALLVAIALAAWLLTRGGAQPRGEQARSVPTKTSGGVIIEKPDPREEGAQNLFTNASKAAALGKLTTAKGYLDRLDRDYANTKYYAAHRKAIADLRAKVQARLKPPTKPATKEAPQPPVEPAGDWVSLFDGKTLNDWEPHLGRWSVVDEQVAIRIGSEDGTLTFTPEIYGDFELEAEVLSTGEVPTPRVGVVFRKDGPRYISYCINDYYNGLTCLGGGVWRGELEGVSVTPSEAARITIASGKWYRLRVKCVGERFECYVNGRLAFTGVDRVLGRGRVGLCAHRAIGFYRNIRLRRLGAEAPAPAGDWVSLFDGKTLGAWQPVERFESTASVEDGKLVLPARPEWNAVHLRVDVPRENYELTYETMRALGSKDFGTLAFRALPVRERALVRGQAAGDGGAS